LSIAEEWASLVASTGPIDIPPTPTVSFLEAAETFLHSPIQNYVDPSSEAMHEVVIPDAPTQNDGFDHNEPSIPVETLDVVPYRDGPERFDANFYADCDLTTGELDHTAGEKKEEGDRSESEDSTSEDDSNDEDYVEERRKKE
ncbi:hypothetical protein PFISCL1PPCAC_22555, partial [Pristionchus fissidentatus]